MRAIPWFLTSGFQPNFLLNHFQPIQHPADFLASGQLGAVKGNETRYTPVKSVEEW